MFDWNPFEPGEAPPERTGIRKKIEQLFHWLMLTVLFIIAFTLSGIFFVIKVAPEAYRQHGRSDARDIGIFIVGGVIGALFLARICFGKFGKFGK